MKKFSFTLVVCSALFLLYFTTCSQSDSESEESIPPIDNNELPFVAGSEAGKIENKNLDEGSGLAPSHIFPNALWSHNDSGNPPILFLIGTNGATLGSYFIQGIENRDWEDIAVGPGPEEGKSYIYVGDIGDNLGIFEAKQIYRIPEWELSAPKKNAMDTIRQYSTISFKYPDGIFDAETLMVDPLTKDIFVVSKRESFVGIYRASYPQSTSSVIELKKMGQFPIESKGVFDQIVGGDISPDGMEVLLKSYTKVYYWKRDRKNQTINDLLMQPPITLPYTPEPQGEAVAFAQDSTGYYSLSEKNQGIEPVLYFYKRNEE